MAVPRGRPRGGGAHKNGPTRWGNGSLGTSGQRGRWKQLWGRTARQSAAWLPAAESTGRCKLEPAAPTLNAGAMSACLRTSSRATLAPDFRPIPGYPPDRRCDYMMDLESTMTFASSIGPNRATTIRPNSAWPKPGRFCPKSSQVRSTSRRLGRSRAEFGRNRARSRIRFKSNPGQPWANTWSNRGSRGGSRRVAKSRGDFAPEMAQR